MTDKIAISYLKTRRKEVSGYKRYWLLRETRDNSEEERKNVQFCQKSERTYKYNQIMEYRTFENHRFPRITSKEVDQDLLAHKEEIIGTV